MEKKIGIVMVHMHLYLTHANIFLYIILVFKVA